MNHATITTTTALRLDESAARNDKTKEKIPLVLDLHQKQVWYLGDKLIKIDQISAIFKDDSGKAGDVGKVSVLISLLDGESFKGPYISTKKNPPVGPNKIDCVKCTPMKENSILKLEFLEPDTDKQHYYPKIFFHTSKGTIDPSIVVERIIP